MSGHISGIPRPSREYRPDIDGLRAVAVISVVVFHTFRSILQGGFAGVDVFFVISGYLISTHLYADFASQGGSLTSILRRFYARRIRRIFPALALVLAATLVAGYFLFLPGEFAQLSEYALGGAGFFANLKAAGDTGYFKPGAIDRPLLHLWSLGVEEQYYLLWPLCIWLAIRSRVGVLPMVVFLGALSFGWNMVKGDDVLSAAYFLPQYRMWELLAGSLLALVPASTVPGDASNRSHPAERAAVIGVLTAAGLYSVAALLSPTPWLAFTDHPVALGAPLLFALLCQVMGQALAPACFSLAVTLAWSRLPDQPPPSTDVFTLPFVLEAVAGASAAASALLFVNGARAQAKGTISTRLSRLLGRNQAALGLALIVVCVVNGGSEQNVPNGWTAAVVLGSLLVIGSPQGFRLEGVLTNRLVVGIGLVSYPLYLWHWPVLSLWQTVAPRLTSDADKLLEIGVASILSIATYWVVERPIRLRRPDIRLVGGLLGAMGCVAAVAFYCDLHHGFRSRLPRLLREIDATAYDYQGHWRARTYFLVDEQGLDAFPNDPKERIPGKPTLFLWGDSYAAALYPGIAHRYGERYNILQRTASGYAPILGEVNPRRLTGVGITSGIFDMLKQARPDVVLLVGHWEGHNMTLLESTLRAVKALKIARVILVGPVPNWEVSLPHQLFAYDRAHPGAPVPLRIRDGVNPSTFEVDRELRAISTRTGVDYFDPLDVFVNAEGTLTRVGESPGSILSFDDGHITAAASVYLVDRLPPL